MTRPATFILARMCWPLLLGAMAACWGGDQPDIRDSTDGAAAASTPVPPYLQPIFAALDTMLTVAQRESLRTLPMDSAFRLRNWRLNAVMAPMMGAWVRTPIGDTVIARGEQSYVTDAVIIDLYQQHLRREPLDIAAALRRISPEYVESLKRYDVTRGAVLLSIDLDASGSVDRLVRESRREARNSLGFDPAEEAPTRLATHRLALYLAAPATASPAWATDWSDDTDITLERTIATANGSLLVVVLSGGDADEHALVFATGGTAHEVLRHQIDYGEGSFALRDSAGFIVVTASGDVQLPGGRVHPGIGCSEREWPGSILVLDRANGRFVKQGEICILRPAT